ncbi:MAG TPA: hypothetical protein VME20_14490, partial [Acidimicrobiales bacterium]|nr:hypothetical protein [Acidimicrobiales bacterium]
MFSRRHDEAREGSRETNTLPASSAATQRETDGHDTATSPLFPSGSLAACQARPAGSLGTVVRGAAGAVVARAVVGGAVVGGAVVGGAVVGGA